MNKDNTFYLLIVGSRQSAFTTSRYFELFTNCVDKVLENQKDKEIIIIQGGCPTGGDYFARKYSLSKNIKCKEFKADWDKYGKSAGYIRNKKMHEYISKYPNRGVFAWWDGKSKGTSHSFELAKKYNNPIRIYNFFERKFILKQI